MMSTTMERMARFRRRRSRSAIWCQRLASFALPFLLITILGHRFGFIDTVPMLWLLGLAVVILLASLVLGVVGFMQLWSDGRKGGLKATQGMLLAIVLLTPFAYYGGLAFWLPPLHDISTDLQTPPDFDIAIDDRSAGMNPILPPTEAQAQNQIAAYPRVQARRYPLGVGRVFRATAELVRERNWTILTSEEPDREAPVDDEGSGLVAKPTTDSDGMPLRIPTPAFRPEQAPIEAGGEPVQIEVQEISPLGREAGEEVEAISERYIEAVATSLVFGFESDVIIRMIEEENGTLIDMRSNSRWGPHDLGSNAARIRAFMSDLDDSLQGLSR